MYNEFAKEFHQTKCLSSPHLEKVQGRKDTKSLGMLFTVWDNLMQNFQVPTKTDQLYIVFLSKVRSFLEFAEPINTLIRLPWDDPT